MTAAVTVRAAVLATVLTLPLLLIAAHAIAERRGYTGLIHAIGYTRWRRRRALNEGCVRCGSTLTAWTWVDIATADRESHCAACHIPGQRFPGSICLPLRDNNDWTIGEVEDRIGRYFEAQRAIETRRERRAVPVPVGSHAPEVDR